jgi:hypothetical protein
MLPPFKIHNLHRKPHTTPYEPSRHRSIPWNFVRVLQVCCLLHAPHVPNSMFSRQMASVSHKNWCSLATPTLQHFLQLRLSSMKTALFWTLMQRVVVIPYRRFGTTCRSHLHGSKIQTISLLLGFFTLDVRIGRLFRNVGTELPPFVA